MHLRSRDNCSNTVNMYIYEYFAFLHKIKKKIHRKCNIVCKFYTDKFVIFLQELDIPECSG